MFFVPPNADGQLASLPSQRSSVEARKRQRFPTWTAGIDPRRAFVGRVRGCILRSLAASSRLAFTCSVWPRGDQMDDLGNAKPSLARPRVRLTDESVRTLPCHRPRSDRISPSTAHRLATDNALLHLHTAAMLTRFP